MADNRQKLHGHKAFDTLKSIIEESHNFNFN